MTPSTKLDLAACEREPIHTPGAIQPHGVLLVADARTGRVVQLAGDTMQVFGMAPAEVLGHALAPLLPSRDAPWLGNLRDAPEQPGYLGIWRAPGRPRSPWDVTAHRRGDRLLVEFEPGTPHPRSAAEGMAALCSAINAIEMPVPIEAMLATAARAMRELTGFDHAVVCRFLEEDGSAAVVAEACDAGGGALLHHRFQASEVPDQARVLYLRNRFRIVPDATYVPAPLLPATGPGGPSPLDMSDCVLGSVPPGFLSGLGGTGMAASMSVSIVVNGRLWGLVACHHAAPRGLPYDVREACRQLGQSLSRQIEAREDGAYHRQAAQLAETRDTILTQVRSDLAAGIGVHLDAATLRDVVPCDGVAIAVGDHLGTHGLTPAPEQLGHLLGWLRSPGVTMDGLLATHRLVDRYPAAAAFADRASGLLAVLSGGVDGLAILWFRRERTVTIDWAGHPGDDLAGETAGAPGSRRAFARWQETVRHTAEAWTEAETDAAVRLGRALGELRQQQTLQELNGRLRHALAEQESLVAQKSLLMQEVHHRVQNSLQIINSMLQLQARQAPAPDVRAQFDAAVGRLMAISAVHQHLWRTGDMQQVRFGQYLQQLCGDLQASWGDGWAGQVTVDAHDAVVSSNTAVTLALMVTELLTNAVKYAYDGRPGPVSVTVREQPEHRLRITVSDQGRGFGEEIAGSGLGSKLIRTFCRQLGGQVDTRSDRGGTTVTIAVTLDGDLPRALAPAQPATP